MGQKMTKFSRVNCSVLVFVKHAESLDEVFNHWSLPILAQRRKNWKDLVKTNALICENTTENHRSIKI